MSQILITPGTQMFPNTAPGIYMDGVVKEIGVVEKDLDIIFELGCIAYTINTTVAGDKRDVYSIIAVTTADNELLGVVQSIGELEEVL